MVLLLGRIGNWAIILPIKVMVAIQQNPVFYQGRRQGQCEVNCSVVGPSGSTGTGGNAGGGGGGGSDGGTNNDDAMKSRATSARCCWQTSLAMIVMTTWIVLC